MSDHEDQPHFQRLSLVVPCYNEVKRLNVEKFHAFLSEPNCTRLVFVDDGSTDRTLGLLKALREGFENRAEILHLPVNGGKAEAVRLGLLHSLRTFTSEFVGFWDADLATPLETIPRFLAVLERNPEIQMVFGARVKLLGRSVIRKESRHYLGRIFATVVSWMLNLPIYDTQCGAKIFRSTDSLRQVLDQPFLSRWVFDVEILARFLQTYRRSAPTLARAIYEYPLESWTDIEGSKVRPRDFLTAILDVARIRRAYLS